jgi:ADP-heptose:LPS heptosyltransferase
MSRVAKEGARILLARPDHLGDVLLSLPAAAVLRKSLPDAHISYLVSPGVAEVPRHCPHVDATYTAPFPPLTGWPYPPGWEEVAQREAAALRGRFDLALLTRPDDPVSGLLVAMAGIPLRLGYDSPRTRPYLTAALPAPDRRHVVTLALDLAAAAAGCLGAQGPMPVEISPLEAPCFAPWRAEEEEGERLLRGLAASCGTSPVLLHPGSGWPLKSWPVSRWGELAARLRCRYGVKPLVICGPGEQGMERAIVEASRGCALGPGPGPGTWLSLGALAWLQQRARLVIAMDGGPLHLAAAMGTPVIGLYGPADPLEFGPWCPAQRRRVVKVELPCSPCRTLVDPPCGATAWPACLTGITVEAVMDAVEGLPGYPERTRDYVLDHQED